MSEYISHSKEETKAIAASLAKTLKGGEVIFAYGDLGAGKTAFCQGLGAALGVKKTINSPTFNLIKVYQGEELSLYHIDCYRLENCDEEEKEIGLEEVVGDPKIICYAEWPDYGPKCLTDFAPRIEISFSYLGEDERKIVIHDKR